METTTTCPGCRKQRTQIQAETVERVTGAFLTVDQLEQLTLPRGTARDLCPICLVDLMAEVI